MIIVSEKQIQKINPTTIDILLTFEDSELKLEQYNFFKNRLDTFKLYLNSEYLLESMHHYDKSSGLLLIELRIRIGDNLLLNDINASVLSDDIIDIFKKFYEVQLEIYKKRSIINSKNFREITMISN
jgi:hypothetical protein